jgi:hypothetical protein
MQEQSSSGVTLERAIIVTPTFVLIDEGREIGRMVGYQGSEFFYGLLDGLLRRLPGHRDYDLGQRLPHLMIQTVNLSNQEPSQ